MSIPSPVLGGMTTFLFANVCVSGIKVITLGSLSRRVRFITAVALAFGLGVTIVPGWATNRASLLMFLPLCKCGRACSAQPKWGLTEGRLMVVLLSAPPHIRTCDKLSGLHAPAASPEKGVHAACLPIADRMQQDVRLQCDSCAAKFVSNSMHV